MNSFNMTYPTGSMNVPGMGYVNMKPYDALVPVNGAESARSYPMPPNSKAVLFDQGTDVFYIKETDASGFPTIRTFKFEPIEIDPQDNQSGFVTKSDLDDAMKGLYEKFEELLNG